MSILHSPFSIDLFKQHIMIKKKSAFLFADEALIMSNLADHFGVE